MPIIGRFGSLAGLGSLILPGGAMESIATVTVGSGGASSITFSDIPSGFQHLQVRGLARNASASTNANDLYLRFNSDNGNNYASHLLAGGGPASPTVFCASSTSTASPAVGISPSASQTASVFGGWVIDILDYASTSKNKTTRCFGGVDVNGINGYSVIYSSLWMSTNVVTSVTLGVIGGHNFTQHSTAALYGLRAP